MTEWPWQASWRWLWLVPFFGLAWRWVGLNGFSAWRRLPFVAVLGLALAAFGTLLSSHFFPGIGPSLHVAAFAALCLFLFDLWRRPRLGVSWAYHFSLWHLWLLLWIAGSACLVALIVIKTDFHDQIRIQGHAAAVESMMRGNLPPHLQAFPEVALKYHFGGDLVAAILGYTLGLPALQAIDALQVGGWVLANLCLYGLARGLGLSRPFSILALHWVLLAAGWAYLFDPSLAWPDSHLVFRKNLNPGVFSYAFQTPYALGFPLFFTYLASLKEWTLKPDLRRLGLAALILGTLSFFHIAFFFGSLACTLGMLAARPLWGEASWHSALIQAALMLAIALLIAISAGGFFSPSEAYNRSVLAWSWPPGYLRHAPNPRAAPLSLLLMMAWYLSTLGSLLLWALPVCALALRDLRNRPRPLS
ncbi:MAG TPA: hypothetical protein VJP40_05820, partial [bacterium]|nr:hypothetical protein [bacterium]